MRQIEGWLEDTVGIGGSGRVIGSGRSGLSSGHRINKVVHADHLEIDVATRRVNQVVTANRGEIAVSRINDDVQLGIREFQASGKGDGAAMCGVKGIQFDVAGDATGTADARDERQRS